MVSGTLWAETARVGRMRYFVTEAKQNTHKHTQITNSAPPSVQKMKFSAKIT